MKQCDKFPSLSISGFCQKLKDKNLFFHEAMTKITPPFECPIKAQTYIINNCVLDLSPFAFIPLSGSLWFMTAKTFAGKNKKLAICFTSVFKIIPRWWRKRIKN